MSCRGHPYYYHHCEPMWSYQPPYAPMAPLPWPATRVGPTDSLTDLRDHLERLEAEIAQVGKMIAEATREG